MDFKHPPMFQRQVSQDAKPVFSTSIDIIDVMKKLSKQRGHPNGTPIHLAFLRNAY